MRRDGWLLHQLPMGMTDDDFFVRFVSIFQEVASTLFDDADTIQHIVDPTVAPVPMLAWLGRWLGVSWLDGSLPEGTQRRVVRSLGEALAWRGTQRGLTTMLEAVTGGPVILSETGSVRRHRDDPAPSPFIRIQVASTGWLDDADFIRVVRDELPVSVACQIEVAGRRIWPITPS